MEARDDIVSVTKVRAAYIASELEEILRKAGLSGRQVITHPYSLSGVREEMKYRVNGE